MSKIFRNFVSRKGRWKKGRIPPEPVGFHVRTSGFPTPKQWVSDTEAVHLRGRKSIRSEQGFYTRSAPGLRFAPDAKQMVQLVHWPHYSQKPHYSYKSPYSQKISMANGIYQSILVIPPADRKSLHQHCDTGRNLWL